MPRSVEASTATRVEPPFLASEPPPLAVRGLSLVLIAGVSAALLLAGLLKLPVTATGRFVLVPVRGADPVRAPRRGIASEVNAVEGQAVPEGAPLFTIRSELASDRVGEEQSLQIRVQGAEERLANASRRHDSRVRADEEEARRLGRRAAALAHEIELTRQRLALAQRLADTADRLYAEKLGPLDQSLLRRMEVSQTEASIARLEGEHEQAVSAVAKLRREMEVRERELEESVREVNEEIRRSKARLAALRESPVTSSEGKIAVRAPCAGALLRLVVRAPGAVVNEGDVLCEVTCEGEVLQAEIAVDESGAGLTKVGQPAKLYYDAFPYERHGVRYGVVRWIGPAARGREGKETPAIRVLAALQDNTFRVAGEPYPILPGMAGRAEVIVDRRSALSYLLDPVRGLRESMDPGPPRALPERRHGDSSALPGESAKQ
jgi:membrane fusion protein